MKVSITFYGRLTDITGTAKLIVENVQSTGELVEQLQSRFQALRGKSYIIAVNDDIIGAEVELSDGARVSFLPPFSGG